MTATSFSRLSRLLCLAALAAAPACALATPVFPDLKIGEANMTRSGDEAELAMLRQFARDNSLVLASKLDITDPAAADPVAGQYSTWSLTDLSQPGYFALKFGIGGTNATADTFFFQNTGDLTQLVWSNAQVQFLTGGACANRQAKCNIGRLSHYITGKDTGPSNEIVEVPEPASLALLGLGLLAAAGARRRKA